jgi:hypothetical protein
MCRLAASGAGRERFRSAEVESLCEIDAVVAQQVQRFAVLDAFGNRLLAEPLGYVDDRFD